MKWTFDWLRDYLKTDLSAEQIADTLTRTGLEVEELTVPVPPIAARIVECRPHETRLCYRRTQNRKRKTAWCCIQWYDVQWPRTWHK